MNLGFNKRQKIIVASIIVTVGLLSTQMVDFNLRFRFLAGLSVLTYLVSLWTLWEGIDRLKAVILLILPTLFTLAVASFYFLLPIRWLTRLPVATVFGLAFYLLLLSQNVFNVAAVRTIPLYRAASTVAFLFTLITSFFLFNVVFAFNLLFVVNAILVFIISFPLILHVLWSLAMEERLKPETLVYAGIMSLSLGEIALVLSFWPMVTIIWSLTLSSFTYILLGLSTNYLKGRLNHKVVWEYLGIGILIFFVAFLGTSWTG
jgi:hypothetical protein